MALWELDEFKPPQFLGFVRAVPTPVEFVGTRWLPNRPIDELEFNYILGAGRKPVMAHVMGYDSEAPIHGRPGLGAKVSGELPPIKRKARIGEKAIIRFLAPRSGSGDVDTAINSVYNTTAELLDSVQSRLEWLRLQALSEDKVVYNEGGVVFSFDYGIADAFQINTVTGLNGAGVSVASTDRVVGSLTSSTFNPLPWLQYITDQIQITTGTRPRELVVSAQAYGLFLTNTPLRDIIRGTGAPSAVLTGQELDTLLGLYNLPTLTTYDVFVTKENDDGTYTDVRTMAVNKSFLPPPNLGSTLLGPTAESRVLYGTPLAAAAPGVWAETYGTTEPPAEWVKVAATAFPTLPYADRLGQVQWW
jgi:hypothetical protein